ncbi:MAG: adenylate/guanylate cyclase domain-containing protein [Ramlibacter sp.]
MRGQDNVEDKAFRQWLAKKSWALAVRYSKTVTWLMVPAALALDVPLIVHGGIATTSGYWLLAWQASVLLTCFAVMLTDRYARSLRGRETPLYLFCGMFMFLTTWAGVRGSLIGGGGLIVYAAGSTFIAAVICTPRRVRRPMYALSLMALGVADWTVIGHIEGVLAALVLPFCTVVLCIELDRFTYSRNLELYNETQRAESERERADKVLYNVLPVPIADELKRDGKVTAVKFENMGVMFADLVGFTSFSRGLPPDALVLVLNEVFSSFDALVERNGVEKIKTMGDAYMVISYQRITSLCQLALDMSAAMARYNTANGTQLLLRIGIHSGPVVAGVIGVKRFLYDVWGDTVNVASRIEAGGESGAIHVSEAVVLQTREAFSFSARDPVVEIRGRGPMATYWLLGTKGDGDS